ncbi:hypothetical protein F2Q69_00037108 [Brassica cretica]|uniref:Uncharacterized protein n=1 Tax=Brassica cretica TaxID=69181 RepID=A0A8S9SQ25_BRACR|nr:hypothetical protein F2Q69_00037108 [Brassica cretica]
MTHESSEQVVNPWAVSAKEGGKIDYEANRQVWLQEDKMSRSLIVFKDSLLVNLTSSSAVASSSHTGTSMRFWILMSEETSSISTLEEDFHQNLCIWAI